MVQWQNTRLNSYRWRVSLIGILEIDYPGDKLDKNLTLQG